ncbi:unnamed protein product [Clonostachys rosea f. rosea IK726]|uniref:Uncharacterized protein n=1 Tax=Clonostachys rosea f. rosea IK726 TaxID=1349383 RepID=A0ACA9TKZ9_BIOOC|nr:unnamed protein product [Clonostachys rosea f. rosea IK726]
MYIPLSLPPLRSLAPYKRHDPGKRDQSQKQNPERHSLHEIASIQSAVKRRQFSEDGTKNANIRTGLIVGLVLAFFLIGVCLFCFMYRYTIQNGTINIIIITITVAARAPKKALEVLVARKAPMEVLPKHQLQQKPQLQIHQLQIRHQRAENRPVKG